MRRFLENRALPVFIVSLLLVSAVAPLFAAGGMGIASAQSASAKNSVVDDTDGATISSSSSGPSLRPNLMSVNTLEQPRSDGGGVAVGVLYQMNDAEGDKGEKDKKKSFSATKYALRLSNMSQVEAMRYVRGHPKKTSKFESVIGAMSEAPNVVEVEEAPVMWAERYLKWCEGCRIGSQPPSNGTAPNGTAPTGLHGEALSFAMQIMSADKQGADYLIKQNPNRTKKLVTALERLGVKNARKKLLKHPEKTLQPFVEKDPDPSDGGILAGGFSVREDIITPALDTIKDMLGDAVHWILEKALTVLTGTPVPEDKNGGIVFIPTNQPWKSLYHNFFVPYVFPLAAVVALLGMIMECGIAPWRALRNPTYSQTRAFTGFIITIVAIMFTMPLIWVLHETVNVVATNVAPSAAELTQSTSGILKLSAGSVLGVIVAYSVGLSEVLFVGLVYAVRYGLLFFVPWFLPLLIALAYNAPHKRLENLASELIWQYIGLLVQVIPVAFLLRAAYEVKWDFGLSGLMGYFASGTIFIAAILLPVVTSIGMFKAAPSVQTVAAGTANKMADSRAADYARQAQGSAARGGYDAMVNMKTAIDERIGSIGDDDDPSRNSPPDSGQL